MDVNIKGKLETVYFKEKVYFNGLMVWITKGLLKHLIFKVLENIHGQMAASIRAKLLMVKKMVLVCFTVLHKNILILDNGNKEKNKEKEKYNIKTLQFMKVNFLTIEEMEMAKWYILRKINMKDNGLMIRNKEKVRWIGGIIIKNIMANGSKICLMGMVNIFGIKIKQNTKFLKMCIKVIGKKEKGQDLEFSFIQMGANIKAIFFKI